MDHSADFENQPQRLLHIAYRMLGSQAEAEDMVQDTWLRWHAAQQAQICEPAAWLTTTITRLSIDFLRSARIRREAYVGPWLPEPVLTEAGPFRDHGEMAGHISSALLRVLETLSPTERAAFLLREVFDYDYVDIAKILDTNSTHCRQVVSRARKRVRGEHSRFDVPREQREDMRRIFSHAATVGDMEGLLKLFEKDIILYSDGGGKVTSGRRPIYGADKVARFFVGLSRKRPDHHKFFFHEINGGPGMICLAEEQVIFALSFHHGEGGYREINVVNNPEKLKYLKRDLFHHI